MGSICVGIFAQTPLFTFWSLLFLEKSGSAVRPLCWESWDDSILCDFIHCCYFHYCIWVPDLKNRVTVFSSVKWKHKCVAEFLWELQRWCPDCCLVPWTVTGVSIGDPTQQSYSWRVSLALFFFFSPDGHGNLPGLFCHGSFSTARRRRGKEWTKCWVSRPGIAMP